MELIRNFRITMVYWSLIEFWALMRVRFKIERFLFFRLTTHPFDGTPCCRDDSDAVCGPCASSCGWSTSTLGWKFYDISRTRTDDLSSESLGVETTLTSDGKLKRKTRLFYKNGGSASAIFIKRTKPFVLLLNIW